MQHFPNAPKVVVEERRLVMLQGSMQGVSASCQNELIVELSREEDKRVILGAETTRKNVVEPVARQLFTLGNMQVIQLYAFIVQRYIIKQKYVCILLASNHEYGVWILPSCILEPFPEQLAHVELFDDPCILVFALCA